MAKDPAFLFYSSDFYNGIQDLTMEERGQFITLLCIQHQKGHLTEKMIRLSVGNATADVMAKFRKDDHGNFFNERLEQEISKRNQFADKQRQRALDGWKKRSHGNATAMPLENENENEDKEEEKKGGKGEKREEGDWSHVPAADLSFNPDLVTQKHDLYTGQQIWMEQTCMVLRIDLNTLERLLFDFLLQKNTQMELNGKSDREIKSYFINWAKSQQDKAKKYQQHGKLTREERDDALKNWSLG